MIQSRGDVRSASWAIEVSSSTARSAARTCSQTAASTWAAGFSGVRAGSRDRRSRSAPRRARSTRPAEPAGSPPRPLACSSPGPPPSTARGSGPGNAPGCRAPRKSPGSGPADHRGLPCQRQDGQTGILSLRGDLHYGYAKETTAIPSTQSWLLSSECRPHSVLAWPAQRPARSSWPASTARVQGQQPIEG